MVFAGVYENGRKIQASFTLVTAGAEGTHTHPDEAGKTPKVHVKDGDAHAHQPGATAGPLPMAVQHETMRKIGKLWIAIGREIDQDGAGKGRRKVTAHLKAIERWSRNLPGFMLHQFPEDKDQFLGLHRELNEKLSDLRSQAASASGPDFKRAYRRLDAMSCTKCHLKFRWGIVKDLSRFPDLSGQP